MTAPKWIAASATSTMLMLPCDRMSKFRVSAFVAVPDRPFLVTVMSELKVLGDAGALMTSRTWQPNLHDAGKLIGPIRVFLTLLTEVPTTVISVMFPEKEFVRRFRMKLPWVAMIDVSKCGNGFEVAMVGLLPGGTKGIAIC